MFARFKSVLLASVIVTSAAVAHADVITFENIAAPGSYQTYSQGVSYNPLPGYSFSTSVQSYVFDSDFYAYGSQYASNGTDYVRLGQGSTTTLKSTVNSVFSVSSIDLANYFYSTTFPGDVTATLTGTFADGKTISKSYLLVNNNNISSNDFQTELLTGFTNLTKFTIATSGYLLDVDNIVLTQGATSAPTTDVPEPASLAILGLGVLGIAAARRRKSA